QLEVQAGPGSLVQWQPPLSGTNPVQTITEPGTYSCTVTSCGSTWSLTYLVGLSQVSADLGTDTFALCQGLPITLTAPPGGDNYLWLPSGDTLPQLMVSTPGTIELIVSDNAGCSASSGPVQIVQQGVTQPATATGDSLCTGETALLNATGTGDLAWYASADTSGLLGTGASFTYVPTATDTVFLLQTENGCPGVFLAVLVFVQDAPSTPVIAGDTLLCFGDTLFLQATGSAGSAWQWTTPTGAFSGPLLMLPNMEAEDIGLYTCQALLGSCSSESAFHHVELADCGSVLPWGEIPNVITPNGDGVNDVFHFAGAGFAHAELHVYNRWGQLIALVPGRNATWDGRNSFSGEVLSEGVYFYTIEAVTDAGEAYRKAGYVQLLR
ncbi:MAG: gliding motility-associated C-terminal domain-containing protein, partial [Flavobacteriales bacterium]